MHTQKTQDQFIELRAQGWSLRHLAGELYVAKRTLVDWNRECAAEIQALRAVELEACREKSSSRTKKNSIAWPGCTRTSKMSWPIADSEAFPLTSSFVSPLNCARNSSKQTPC